MESFTPVSGSVGGVLIGAAATLLLAGSGRIAGISGIAGGLLSRIPGDNAWRVLFLIGLVLGAGVYQLVTSAPLDVRFDVSTPWLIAAGFLVGFGTRLGGGCTSGHGVCGIARFSVRSVFATLVFIGVAMLTTFVLRQLLP
ncbi:MAG TPA: YeeE/YedE thiosulfate transporter family protein [Gammaproteobacteria bacterium]|nr:YeeE/YedE thiosulfate transporter family protein [Gammaproteobacteria bacterium]